MMNSELFKEEIRERDDGARELSGWALACYFIRSYRFSYEGRTMFVVCLVYYSFSSLLTYF
jgi:hypothetical protein